MRAPGRARAAALLALSALSTSLVAGCGSSGPDAPRSQPTPTRTDVPAQLQDVAMARPAAFRGPADSADILVQSQDTLPASLVKAVSTTKGVTFSDQFSLATFYSEENQVTYAAVDPAKFRYFTYGATANSADVWDRVADGEIAITPGSKKMLAGPGDYVTMGNDDDAEKVHIGAYAPLIERSPITAVVNERWAEKLNMVRGNALLLSTGDNAPADIYERLKKYVGTRATVSMLALDFDVSASQVAVLTGGSVSRAVGSFTYTANRDGTVNPDPRWVSEFIRTEQVPIIGDVRCNKAMLIQLRAALTEVVERGLASRIHPSEYGGCYVPRFIAKDPAKGLSFHTFGTAIDLNVPGNLRGTVGQMDRTVVSIFKKWGFAWGGDWNYTDPMHFELARIVAVR